MLNSRNAFSLVELSIVLVILGLLTGGILGGQALIRAAEKRTLATEYQAYAVAVNSFKDRYMALPGDFSEATKFWGSASGDGRNSTCRDTNPSSNGTCEGDGNGQINGTAWGGTIMEMPLVWEHLGKAGLIAGNWTGAVPVAPDYIQTPGVHVPVSKSGNRNVWSMCYSQNGNPGRGPSNVMAFGSVATSSSAACGPWQGSSINPQEAWEIDTKIDDGKAGRGFMIGEDGYIPGSPSGWENCVTTNYPWTDPSAEYYLNDMTAKCRLYFQL